jgi:hypothetical protein
MTSPSIGRKSWRGWNHSVQQLVHTRVYDVNLLKKGEMDVDGRRPSHSLPCCWLEFCDEISDKSTTGGGDPTD